MSSKHRLVALAVALAIAGSPLAAAQAGSAAGADGAGTAKGDGGSGSSAGSGSRLTHPLTSWPVKHRSGANDEGSRGGTTNRGVPPLTAPLTSPPMQR